MSKNKNKYYVVWSGKDPGIYDSWEACERQVKGVEGARYKGFPTREEAENAFAGSPLEYFSQAVKQKVDRLNIALLPSEQQPQYPALAVDGACSGNPGKMEYQGVDAATGTQIFHYGPVLGGTNNIGEFLAIVHALALMKRQAEQALAAGNAALAEQLLTMRIYSDSRTAQAWVRERKCKTKLAMTEENAQLFQVIQRAENWLQVNSYRNPVVKWQTELWGEIPADFGRK